jgi:hypothetical protein
MLRPDRHNSVAVAEFEGDETAARFYKAGNGREGDGSQSATGQWGIHRQSAELATWRSSRLGGQ